MYSTGETRKKSGIATVTNQRKSAVSAFTSKLDCKDNFESVMHLGSHFLPSEEISMMNTNNYMQIRQTQG